MVPFGISAFRNRDVFSTRGVSTFRNAQVRDMPGNPNGAYGPATLALGAMPVRPMYIHVDTRCYPDLRPRYGQQVGIQPHSYMVLPSLWDRGIQTDF